MRRVDHAEFFQPAFAHELWSAQTLAADPAQPRVAIVGSRDPAPEAAAFARDLAAALASAGCIILSGGALGIDSAAHEGALRAGGTTWAFLPCGGRQIYPSENAQLFDRIEAANGALLRLAASDVVAKRHAFFRRNEALVCAATSIVVVQAQLRSGARNAAAFARKQQKPVHVVAGLPWDCGFQGCREELTLGAQPIVSLAHLVHALTGVRAPRIAARTKTLPTTPLLPGMFAPARATAQPATHSQQPLSAIEIILQRGPQHAESLAEQLGLALPALNRELVVLELEGRVRAALSGLYALT